MEHGRQPHKMEQQIIACGFTPEQARESLKRKNTVEGAIHWILSTEGTTILEKENLQQQQIPSPSSPSKNEEDQQFLNNPLAQQVLQCGMGFTAEQAQAANKRCSSLERCIEWILTHSNAEGNGDDEEEHPEQRECGICYCEELQSNMVLCECEPDLHWICNDCFRSWCHSKIDDHEVLNIGCPQGGDGCQQEVTHFVVSAAVDEAHRDKYQRLLMEKDWAEHNARVVRCPACNFMTEWAEESQVHSIECHNTNCETQAFCGLCGMPPHFREGDPEMSMDCAAYAEWRAANDGANKAFADYIEENQVQTCPNCHEACEKQGGCNFMYCKCKAMFCLHCGQKLSEKEHFTHFGKFGPYGHGCLNKEA